MVRDGVANIVFRLQELGFEPRKVGVDSWESRCPAHRAPNGRSPSPEMNTIMSCSSAGVRSIASMRELSVRSVSRTTMCARKPPIG